MALVIDANMKLISDKMGITTSRLVRDYGLATVEEIIESEAEKGNKAAVNYAREAYHHSPEKLIKIFELTDVENRFRIINKMNERTRLKLLKKMDKEDMVFGLNFFTQEKLLKMLLEVSIVELVNVVLDVFSLEEVMKMFREEDLSQFFLRRELEKEVVLEQIKNMPAEMLQKFVEGVTGMPMQEKNTEELLKSLGKMPDEDFRKFMSEIDPDVQRQITFQLAKEEPKYLTLFTNDAYVNMLKFLQKPDMIKPMIMLNHDSLTKMIEELPKELMSVCMSQISPRELAKFLQKGNMRVIEKAWLM